MSEEDKVRLAIEFIATGQPIPDVIEGFLRDTGLYEQLMEPLDE